MSLLKTADYAIKKLNSILFRLVNLICFLIICLSYNNYFPAYIYFLATIVYVAIYLALFRKNKIGRFLRLINDFCILNLILYGKPVNELGVGLLLFLPLINTLNHSTHNEAKPLPYKVCFLITVSFLIQKADFRINFWLPLVVITCINCLIYFRFKLMGYIDTLYNIIDKFYENNFNIGKTHNILKNFIEKHNNISGWLKRFLPIRELFIFRIRGTSNIQLLLSSRFVIKHDFSQEETFVKKIFESKSISNWKVSLDAYETSFNYSHLYSYKGENYIAFTVFETNPFSPTLKLYVERVLNPIFNRIIEIIHVEHELNLENKRFHKIIKKNHDEINDALNAIHYLNNRLSPITNYFEMLRVLPTISSEETRKSVEELIQIEKNRAINNITPIADKMNQMAQRSNFAHVSVEPQVITLRKVFSLIRKSFDEQDELACTIENHWSDETFRGTTQMRVELFEFVIDELISNLIKYSKGKCTVLFTFDDNNVPLVKFINEIKNYDKVRANLIKTVNDFNQSGINEILKRKSRGLLLIKTNLLQLNLVHQLSVIDTDLVLTLTPIA